MINIYYKKCGETYYPYKILFPEGNMLVRKDEEPISFRYLKTYINKDRVKLIYPDKEKECGLLKDVYKNKDDIWVIRFND